MPDSLEGVGETSLHATSPDEGDGPIKPELNHVQSIDLWSSIKTMRANNSSSDGLDDTVSSPADSVHVEPAQIQTLLIQKRRETSKVPKVRSAMVHHTTPPHHFEKSIGVFSFQFSIA